MASKDTLAQVWLMLAEAYPQAKQVDVAGTAKLYARLLADIPDDLLEAAALHVIGRSKFFPAVAELRDAAFDLRKTALALPTALEAWGEVMAEVRRSGSYREPRFSSDVIRQAVVALGGWQSICLSENVTADRARFVEVYDQLTGREDAHARLLPSVRGKVTELAAALADKKRLKSGTDDH